MVNVISTIGNSSLVGLTLVKFTAQQLPHIVAIILHHEQYNRQPSTEFAVDVGHGSLLVDT